MVSLEKYTICIRCLINDLASVRGLYGYEREISGRLLMNLKLI